MIGHRSYVKGLTLLLCMLLFLGFIYTSDRYGMNAIIVVLGLSGLILVYSLVSQLRNAIIRPAHRLSSKDFSLKFTATLMGLCLIMGTALYICVFWEIGHNAIAEANITHPIEFNNVEYLLRSLICSLDLFMLDVDSNILDRLDHNAGLKAAISVQAVISFSCTVAMLVSLVYSRLHAYYKLAFRTKITNRKNHLYLFFGVNKPSENLIKDIRKNDDKAVIVLIDKANVKEDDTDAWDGIVGLLTHRQKTFDVAEKNSVDVAIAGQDLADIEKEVVALPDFDAWGYLGLSRIKKLINKLSAVDDGQLHIFFLDNDEERNIRNIMNLAKDSTILSIARDGSVSHRIYCHARYNGPNRVIQDVALRKKLNIKIIDSSHIAVERLKILREFHPIHVANVSEEKPVTVEGRFNALIIGFGEVGRDAFRFLYEFGAFVDSDVTDTRAHRSPFVCKIVDKNLEAIEGPFKAMMPGIFEGENRKNFTFYPIDVSHAKFFDEVLDKNTIKDLNYVIISIGDNDEAISLAARIFNRFRQYGGDMRNIRILVRCTDDAKVEAVQKIADHYNYGYGMGEDNTPVIRIFGQPEETYTYDLVISNYLVEAGKEFHENYRILKGENETWDQRHKRYTETGVPNIDKLRTLRRKESQDLANAMHVGTKIEFLRRAMPGDFDWFGFIVRYFDSDGRPNSDGRKAAIFYRDLNEDENIVVKRLAMLEHLRWNAAHELLGYVSNDEEASCNETKLKHNCLTDWEHLDDQSKKTEYTEWPCDYKSYDFAVVDTTIHMSKDELTLTSEPHD